MKNIARGSYDEILVEDGIYILKIQNDTQEPKLIERDIDSSYIQFHFCLKGRSKFNFNEGNYYLEVNEENSLLLYNTQKDLPLDLVVSPGSWLLSVVMTFTSDESRYQELCAQGRAAARSGNLDLAESFYARARDILPKRLEALSALELIALRRKRGETGTGAPDKSSPNKSSPGESSTDRNKSSEGAGEKNRIQ